MGKAGHDAVGGGEKDERMRQREDTEEEEALGRSLKKLPARLGGLGLLSFKDVAPLACRSAAEASDILLDS